MPVVTPDLLFGQQPLAAPDLVFGGEGTSSVPAVTVTAAIELGSGVGLSALVAPTVSVQVALVLGGGVGLSALAAPSVRVQADLVLGGVTLAAGCIYDNRVTPYKEALAHSVLGAAIAQDVDLQALHQTSMARRDGVAAVHHTAQAHALGVGVAAGRSIVHATAGVLVHQTARQHAVGRTASQQAAVPLKAAASSAWQLGQRRRAAWSASNQAGIARALFASALHQTAVARSVGLGSPAGASLHFVGIGSLHAPWGTALVLRQGVHLPPVVPPVVPPHWGGDLLFQCPPLLAPFLFFGGKTPCDVPAVAAFAILPARFYMTAHTIIAHRLPDLAEVPIYDATVSADAGSYCWTLSASGPASLFTQLAPQSELPVQLRLTLDGIPFVFAVDSINRTSAFGKTGVSISARSVTTLIGAPYMRASARGNAAASRMAQQLAQDALEYTGVGLDWGITDWLVGAGAWSHNGTPLDAVQAIAAAAGGYLQSHRSAATLLVRHPYSQRTGDNPGAPWGWMTGPADVELAPDAIITDGTERKDGADINAVYVSGTTQGVLGLVKRTGTAADKLAAMVTDPLITHTDAARQRGLAILGAAGPQYSVRLELPVLTGVGQPGVLDVGQLVQINTAQPWRGRVRAVSVTAKRPSLRQTITLERHLEAA